MGWRENIDASGAQRQLVTHRLPDNVRVAGEPDELRAGAAAAAVAQGVDGARTLTLDEYTLACVMASEDGNANASTIASLGDATLNRAARKGVSVFQTATAGQGFGRGKGGRPMTTAIGPRVRHVRAAIALTRGGAQGPRGVARGAFMWFNAATQTALSKRGDANHAPAKLILERWCYGNEFASRPPGPWRLGPRRGPVVEWVGRTDGIDPFELMLFRPATDAHAAQYAAALAVIERRGADLVGLAAAAVVLAAGAVMA